MTDYSCSIEMLLEALYCANTSQKVCLLKLFFFIWIFSPSTSCRFCVCDLTAFTFLQVWKVTRTCSSCCWVESWSRFAPPPGRRCVSSNCRKTAKQYGTSHTKNSIGTKHVSVDARPEHGGVFFNIDTPSMLVWRYLLFSFCISGDTNTPFKFLRSTICDSEMTTAEKTLTKWKNARLNPVFGRVCLMRD